MNYSEDQYRRDRAHREREKALEGDLITLVVSRKDCRELVAALESPSVTSDRAASLYYRIKREMEGA